MFGGGSIGREPEKVLGKAGAFGLGIIIPLEFPMKLKVKYLGFALFCNAL